MKSLAKAAILSAVATSLLASQCTPSKPKGPEGFENRQKVRMTIRGQAFELWVADEPAATTRGLMFVTREELAPLPDGTERGMLFVFQYESRLSFWMKNTIIPLDIAYINSSGKVVSVHTMAPLDVRPGQYPSGLPAKYAIEVNANVLVDLGLESGDQVEIPVSALKRSP